MDVNQSGLCRLILLNKRKEYDEDELRVNFVYWLGFLLVQREYYGENV